MQNGFIERFNRIYRESILDAYVFFDLNEVRWLTQQWLNEYNERRPHKALGNHTPKERKEKLLQAPGFIGGKNQKTPDKSCLNLGVLTRTS